MATVAATKSAASPSQPGTRPHRRQTQRLCGDLGLRTRKIGVVLAGDLHTHSQLHKRFGVGDVGETWDAFADRFRWVTGVLGNVDRLSTAARKRHALLESELRVFDGLRVAGVSGIIGDARLENLRPQPVVLRDLDRVVRSDPDLLVLHEGPSVPGEGLRGSEAVRRALRSFAGTVVCGHCTWPKPRARLRAVEVLNTDGRCVLLTCG
jgi:Icc protein